MRPQPGTTIDKYTIVRLIGRGGMAAVYEARHNLVGKRCALKILLPEYGGKQELVQRMLREAQAAAAIGHPNIVDTFDFGILPDGACYLVMEYLEGRTLAEVLAERGKLDVPYTLGIMDQVLSALEAAHKKGIVHRDIKPENIFLATSPRGSEEVKLLDFGISKIQHDQETNIRLTRTGMVLGTPYYMSPEQASGSEQVDHRADLWAVGVILYECLTGQVPFDGETYPQVIIKLATTQPVPPRNLRSDLPPSLEAVILKALRKNPLERWQDATRFRRALRDIARELAPGPLAAAQGAAGVPSAWGYHSDVTRSLPWAAPQDATGLPAPPEPEHPAPASQPALVHPAELLDGSALGPAHDTLRDSRTPSDEDRATVVERPRPADQPVQEQGPEQAPSTASGATSAGHDVAPHQTSWDLDTGQYMAALTSRRWAVLGLGGAAILAVLVGVYLSTRHHGSEKPERSAGARPQDRRADLSSKDRGPARHHRPNESAHSVRLEVHGLPPGAHVFLDGRRVHLPATLRGNGTRHVLRIVAAGYEPYVKRFRAGPGTKVIRILPRLTRRRLPRRTPPRRVATSRTAGAHRPRPRRGRPTDIVVDNPYRTPSSRTGSAPSRPRPRPSTTRHRPTDILSAPY